METDTRNFATSNKDGWICGTSQSQLPMRTDMQFDWFFTIAIIRPELIYINCRHLRCSGDFSRLLKRSFLSFAFDWNIRLDASLRGGDYFILNLSLNFTSIFRHGQALWVFLSVCMCGNDESGHPHSLGLSYASHTFHRIFGAQEITPENGNCL